MKKKMVRNIITGPMHYQRVKNEDGTTGIVAAKDIDLLNYKTLKSAYNPLYPDTGKVVKIPEDCLYPNARHHLKKFIIIDGRIDSNGDVVIIGFLATSKTNPGNKVFEDQSNDLIAINKLIFTKDKYKRLISKSRSYSTDITITDSQKKIIKQLSKTESNVKKSTEFRKKITTYKIGR